MKKFAAIFYLSLLLFTATGYRLLINLLEKSAIDNLQQVIEEKTYDPAHLIELSVNLNLPYLSDWQNWEAVEGMVTIEGIPYQYVERILQGGKMTYRCLPNSSMQQAQSARDRFMKFSFDLTHPSGKNTPMQSGVSIKPPLPELFCFDLFSLASTIAPEPTIFNFHYKHLAFSSTTLSVPTPPPNVV